MAAAKKSEPRQFDPKRPHGVIYNHLSAKYEQDGIQFGANGLPVDPEQLERDEEKLEAENRKNEAARLKELESKGGA